MAKELAPSHPILTCMDGQNRNGEFICSTTWRGCFFQSPEVPTVLTVPCANLDRI